MELLLDTANIPLIEKYQDIYQITGVTTNPTILTQEKSDFREICGKIKETIGDKQLHIQVTALNWEEMLKEAEFIINTFGKNTYIKVPVTESGMKAMKELKRQNCRVTATAVYLVEQAFLAGSIGVDYVAPYFNRICNMSIDAKQVIARIADLFQKQNIPTKILAASFKNTQQVLAAYEAGAHGATISPELLTTMCTNPIITDTVNTFQKHWFDLYGGKYIYEM